MLLFRFMQTIFWQYTKLNYLRHQHYKNEHTEMKYLNKNKFPKIKNKFQNQKSKLKNLKRIKEWRNENY